MIVYTNNPPEGKQSLKYVIEQKLCKGLDRLRIDVYVTKPGTFHIDDFNQERINYTNVIYRLVQKFSAKI